MNADVFLDTNVLVYAASGEEAEKTKQDRARVLIDRENFGTSSQVLQEFYVTIVRKVTRPAPALYALEWIDRLAKLPCQYVDHRMVRTAIEISLRYSISYWDAAILAAAEALGAHTVYSEDLNHGQQYGRVRVVNPFL